MAIAILWTQRAIAHLEAELDYYENIHRKLSKELSHVIKESIEKLKHAPGIGRPGKHMGTREFILSKYPYVIAYRVRDNILEILAFIHQKRKNIQSFY